MPSDRRAHRSAEAGRTFTADIAPCFTILVVGHIIVPLILLSEKLAALPLRVTIWPLAALALACWFPPRVKGCIIGLMWALDMQGRERR